MLRKNQLFWHWSDLPPSGVNFDDFVLDPVGRCLRRDGVGVLDVEPTDLAVLVFLASRPNEALGKNEIAVNIWPRDDPEDRHQSIRTTLSKLKYILGPADPVVRNVRHHGYRFDLNDHPPRPSLLPRGIVMRLQEADDAFRRRTGASVRQALKLYREAIDLDPQCIRGHLGVAACITVGCHVGFAIFSPAKHLAEAYRAGKAAFSLAVAAQDTPSLAKANTKLALLHMLYEFDFVKAQRLLEDAVHLDRWNAETHQYLAHLYLATNRWSEAKNEIEFARNCPLANAMIHCTHGWLLHFMRQPNAVRECEEASNVHDEFARGHMMLGWAYEGAGQLEFAEREFLKGMKDPTVKVTGQASLGHLYALAGRKPEARAQLKELQLLAKKRHVSPYFLALVHVGLGDSEKAIRCLQEAYREKCDWLIHAGVEPRWDPLRSSEDFKGLLAAIGLLPLTGCSDARGTLNSND